MSHAPGPRFGTMTAPAHVDYQDPAEIGRDATSITRSIHVPVSYQEPGVTRDTIGEGVGAGFRHIALGPPSPYPADVARWVADQVIGASA
jgi:hypothetical protein